MADISYFGAFTGGILSFVSPCVLPLVPPYLAYLSGLSMAEYKQSGVNNQAFFRLLLATLSFVLGFSIVFVLLGAGATLAGQWLRAYSYELGLLSGVIIIFLGLHFLGVLNLKFLNKEMRFQVANNSKSTLQSFIIGFAFAFGWTPCITPVLAPILTMAATKTTVLEGAWLLAVYSFGLGIPFIFAGLNASLFMAFLNRSRKHMLWVEKGIGIFLIIFGLIFVTNSLGTISTWLLEVFPILAEYG